jgi:hypothetical protein
MMPKASNKFRHLALGVLLFTGGCAQFAGLFANAQGPPDVAAEYIPKKVDTLVLAEADPSGTADDINARDIGRRVEAQWRQHQLGPLVDSNAVETLRGKTGTQFRRMSISEIGRAVGAKQVLYVNVMKASVDSTGDMLRGASSVRVKIVEVSSSEALWPSSTTKGEEVSAQSDGVTESSVMDQTREVLAEELVKKFYKWNPENGAR